MTVPAVPVVVDHVIDIEMDVARIDRASNARPAFDERPTLGGGGCTPLEAVKRLGMRFKVGHRAGVIGGRGMVGLAGSKVLGSAETAAGMAGRRNVAVTPATVKTSSPSGSAKATCPGGRVVETDDPDSKQDSYKRGTSHYSISSGSGEAVPFLGRVLRN